MPTYLMFRTVGELSDEELEAAFREGLEVAEELPGMRWIRSYYSAEEGKLYCEWEAPGVELLYEFAERTGVPLDRVTVVQDLEPSMFW